MAICTRVGSNPLPIWEENEWLKQQVAELQAEVARLHDAVSIHRRERKHLG